MQRKEKILFELGNRVRELRIKKGLTQKLLAYKIGKDQQSIQRLEKGAINPTYIYLLEICEGLEIELVELVK